MADVTKIDIGTLAALVEHKSQILKKLKLVLKHFRGAQDEDSIYFSHERLREHNIHVSTMDIEDGGRFFKPVPLSEFKAWIYEEKNDYDFNWSSDKNSLSDADGIYYTAWGIIDSVIPEHAQTEDRTLFIQYTPWNKLT
ncbi:uncharacterized protein GIQ15_00861 [Arthroderma uncinatum]|uniref:uncharacterized protein n=1 Tax=Arthroderma uncinatum TaxID=74035 RepID=UPI00144ABF31|nr:uncharacterized protein GIQ15_00861 [Arthroderma uncinatum]KAF3491344.1 hypothetical protein GIQ15_00861 [Arthroderma uncinatum]